MALRVDVALSMVSGSACGRGFADGQWLCALTWRCRWSMALRVGMPLSRVSGSARGRGAVDGYGSACDPGAGDATTSMLWLWAAAAMPRFWMAAATSMLWRWMTIAMRWLRGFLAELCEAV